MEPDKEKLVLENTGLAGIVIKQFIQSGIEWEELQSLCYMGLVKAALAYDENRGSKFSTLAVTVMRREILKELGSRTGHICPLQTSLDTPVKNTENGELTLNDVQSCMEEGYDRIEENDLLQSICDFDGLKEKEKIVLLLWVNGERQDMIGKNVGTSQSQVSRIIKRSARKLYVENFI